MENKQIQRKWLIYLILIDNESIPRITLHCIQRMAEAATGLNKRTAN